MTDAAAQAPPPARRRWPMIFLVASLALNALLLGVIMRGLWIARANIVMTGGAIETSLPAFVSTLPASRREELRRSSLAEQPAAIRPLRRELRRARTEAYRAFIAEPFDKAAFVAAQNRLFEAESNLRRTMQHLLPEMGERLTAAERRAYMSWRGHGWGGGRRGDRGDRGVSRDLDQPGVSPRRE